MVYLSTEIGLTPDGSGTVHIYTQAIRRTTQITTNFEECGPCPIFSSFTPAFALQLRKRHGKTSVRVAEEWQYTLTHFLSLEEVIETWTQMYIGLRVKCPLFLSNINEAGQIFEKYVAAELFHADGQTWRSPVVPFRSFANTPENAKNRVASATNSLLHAKIVRHNFL